MKKSITALGILLALTTTVSLSSCSEINAVGDNHFTSDGVLNVDSSEISTFIPTAPSHIKFYVEVSGSMNGFFRANKSTDFKKDVWQIMSYYSSLAPSVFVLTNDGNTGAKYTQSQFQTLMNTGAFVSTASTKVPVMLKSIFNELDSESGEVAVLISDMKYSPVGEAAPEVLMSQYSTDISKILGLQEKAVSLIGATSNYLEKNGGIATPESPYYFFVIGSGPQVAFVRNGISAMLQNNNHFIDNIESGFDYGTPSCSFGIPDNCYQMDEVNPTFVDFDQSTNDTCTITLKVNLENYRWITAEEDYFKEAFNIKSNYGSNIKIGDVKFEISNITDKELIRSAKAIVQVKVFDMAMDAEVLEWSLTLPDVNYDKFYPYFENATNENDVTKSYSVKDFVKGIFYGGVVNKTLKPNFILISKNS